MNFKIVSSVAIAAVSTLLFTSCDADPDSAGLEYMPDMYRSAAIEPYVDYGEIRGKVNEEAKMTVSAKAPPHGTVPYYGTNEEEVMIMLPYQYLPNASFKSTHGMYGAETTEEDSYTMAASQVNPLKLTAENADQIFDEGKRLFNSKCAHCHGAKGDGQGPMVASGAYVGVPDYATLKNLGDGQMFYSIYYGRNMMGSHGNMLNKKQIWTLVHYIRKFQDSSYGPGSSTEAEVAPEEELAAVEPVGAH